MKQFERIRRRRLGEILLDEGYVTRDQLDDALAQQDSSRGEPLGRILIGQGILTERALARAMVNQLQLPYLSTDRYHFSKEVVGLVPTDLCFKHEFVPLDRIGDCLCVLAAGLMPPEVVEAVQRMTGCEVFFYIGTISEVQDALQQWVSPSAATLADVTLDSSMRKILDDDDPRHAPTVEEETLEP
jgi:type IV pilus assembly protein PilB